MLNYELPKLSFEGKRILAFDPGSVNMGISLVELTDLPHVRANATMSNPIHDIKYFMHDRRLFLHEVKTWISLYGPTAIVAERFQARGLRGPTVECVSMMLGVLSMLKLPVLFITASTWKNNFQRRFGVNLRDVYREIRTTPHQLDASLIGCYGIQQATRKVHDFDFDTIVEEVRETALNGLKRR